MKTQRRKSFLIDKSFQSGIAWRAAGLVALEAVLMAIFFLYVSRGTFTTSYVGGELKVERTTDFFFASFFMVGAITVVGMALISMVVFIILTHRIAGPVHRLQRRLEDLRRGDLAGRVRLRHADELSGLADELNRSAEFLDAKISELKRELKRASSKSGDAEAREALKRLEELANSFKTSA